ncbi:hypothetical protein FOL47_000712 [Perkinsus chesapeaki]|uniref:CCHC-type domain-containing protein n=1 Tax=Perkinsus chesapeaki TaxID=330153 RepID=A0A7J6KVX1_PERCH|nr:hypothetical protein FOL47_000712 [Perkinsus chesapeaki]
MSAEITTPPTNITYGPELPPGSSVNPNPGTLIFHPPLLRPATTNQLLGYDQPDNVENGQFDYLHLNHTTPYSKIKETYPGNWAMIVCKAIILQINNTTHVMIVVLNVTNLPNVANLTNGVNPLNVANSHNLTNYTNVANYHSMIAIKDYDSAERVVDSLKPLTRFHGAEDRRSGTAFIDEMFTMTEGHPEVVKYLWLKRYTTSYVWTMITDGIQPPTRCHRAYELQRSQLIHRISHHYDSLDHVQRSGEELAHCTQGKTTVYQFIRKLETLASELYNLGSPVPYRDLKLRLHKGLRSMMLRQKLDVDLMNDQMPFEHFRDQVLLQHKRLVNYYGVDYETKEIGGISVRQLPEPYRTTGSHTRGRSRDSNREHSYRSRDYTPKSTTSDEPTTKRRSSVHSVSHYGEDQQDDYSIKHLLAIRNDVTGFKCFRCDAEGHSAKNCPELSPVGLTTRCRVCGNPEHTTDSCRINAEKLLCHRCNLPGHLAYVCGTKLPVASTTKVLGPTTATTRTQSATGKGSGRQTSNRGRPNTTVHAAFLNETTTETGSHCYTLRSSRTRTPTPDPRVLHRHGMMTGYVTIEDTEVIAIYDTGADVSLITASCLNEVAPDATINTNIPNTLSAANGGNLHTIGSVMLRVSTSRTSEVDTFLVTTVPLTTPVILGCPTMSLLKTRITINSAGYDIETNYATPTDKYKVRFHDHVQYSDDDSKEPTPLPHCVVDYKIKHINQLCLQEHCEPCDYDGFTLQPTTPWFSTIFPETTSIPINDDSLIRGQGPCNHGRNDTKDTTTLGYGVTNCSGPPNNCVTTVANGDDANSGDYTTLGYGVTNCSGPPNNCVTTVANGDDANSGDYLDYTSEEDNLPPWQVLQREWTFDENTPLGRAIVHAPWKDSTRPPMNYRQAAARGARCTTRLSSTQLDAFHQALDSYINKKFCTTVQQNNIDNYEKGPSFKDCQDAWDKLTKGTSYEGTTVIMPKHYTAAHLVYRNDHPTTPCRVVLDYRTLNQYLLRGGRTQHDLQGTLLQLRAFVHFVGSDISKAFCQMKTALSDLPYVNYTCIGNYTVLWSSVSFGTTSAPNYLECCMHDISGEAEALCQVASTTTSNGVSMNADQLSNDILLEALLRPSQEAFDYIRSGPEVPVELILLKYVDDLFNGGDTPEAAMRANKFSLHILGGHGFKVDALKNIDSWTKLSDTETKKSILGYRYHDEKLYIVYSGELVNGPITKRQACSALASLYDPLGLIIECDLKGRLIWRTICDNYKLWTDIVDINVANEIRDWILECEETTKLGIPRHIPLATQPLLVSTDASTNFWGVDIRCTNNKEISPRLLARGGLFPKAQEKWTIPRKELVALYKGLQLLKTISPYLPVPTYYKANQSPLDSLAPVLQPRQVRLLCDSEITIYRLRKPSNDKRLPAAERRRLIEVRKLCKELDVIILHIRSELNYVDTVSRAKLQQDHIDPSEVLRATTVAKVIYDYRDTPDKDEDDVPMIDTSATTTGIMAINEDGIDLPDVDPLPTEQRLELEALMAYAKPTDRIHEGLLEDTQYNDSLRNCILRAQEEDEDIQRFVFLATMVYYAVTLNLID